MVYICILIMIASAGIGKMVTSIYLKREGFFAELYRFCGYLIINIAFFQSKMEDIYGSYTKIYQSSFADIFTKFKQFTKGEIDDANLFSNLLYLKNDEKNMMKRFVLCIGNNDEKNQIEILEEFKKYFKEKSELCTKIRREQEGLVYKISLSVGAVICVLII